MRDINTYKEVNSLLERKGINWEQTIRAKRGTEITPERIGVPIRWPDEEYGSKRKSTKVWCIQIGHCCGWKDRKIIRFS